MAALGVVMTALFAALDLAVDDVTLAEAFPYAEPFIDPVHPANTCPWPIIIPTATAPITLYRLIAFFMIRCSPFVRFPFYV
jgi:hypothetical protein